MYNITLHSMAKIVTMESNNACKLTFCENLTNPSLKFGQKLVDYLLKHLSIKTVTRSH